MSKLAIGIVGLPNVGKSTLFNILTGQEILAANYPFATIDPNVGVVAVPDDHLDKLSAMSESKKKVPAVVEFYDIAGLVKGASKGEGLGNKFLANIREVNAIVEVVRCFENGEITHVEGSPDPERDIDIIDIELQLKDEESSERENLLSKKPKIILFNGSETDVPDSVKMKLDAQGIPYLVADLDNVKAVPELAVKAYEALGLMSFYTTGDTESRAWTIRRGAKAPQAAGVIHTDFEKTFIKADVVNADVLFEYGSWQKAKAAGKVRLEGKDYEVQDGDVMIIRHG